MLHSTVARSVRWRSGRSTGRFPTRRALLEPDQQRGGSSNRVRAAASSIASGRPSRRRQISMTATRCRRSARSHAGRPGAIDEQLHGGQRCDLFDRRPLRGRRHASARRRVLALRPQPEHGAARGEDLEAGAATTGAGPARVRRRRPVRGCRGSAAPRSRRSARSSTSSGRRLPSIVAPDDGGDAWQHELWLR